MTYEVRPLEADDWHRYLHSLSTAFGGEFRPDDTDSIEQRASVTEFDRTLTAVEDGQIVSTASAFTFELTVPGGVLPMAGVTHVGVQPTHRRRGILRSVMQRQLSDVREAGEPLAGLWASESVIYGRFGYGLAATATNFTIDREHTRLARATEPNGRFRLVTREDALRDWPALYDRVRVHYPGFYTRSEAWWANHRFRAISEGEKGGRSLFWAQYERGGSIEAYVAYTLKGGDDDFALPAGTLEVRELIASDAEAEAAMWQYLFGVDLVKQIRGWLRPSDDPLFYMLADPRRLRQTIGDSLWLRIVDVERSLPGRRYAVEGRLVFEVRDEFCSWAAGRYVLDGGPEGATCRRTDAEAEITLSAADLGAVYLGGPSFDMLRRAGRVEGSDTAVRNADTLFAWRPAPWCPEVF
jgi:predicted acetyltransferase